MQERGLSILGVEAGQLHHNRSSNGLARLDKRFNITYTDTLLAEPVEGIPLFRERVGIYTLAMNVVSIAARADATDDRTYTQFAAQPFVTRC